MIKKYTFNKPRQKMRWYREYTGAETYSENTTKVFHKKEIIITEGNLEEEVERVIRLIETMKYNWTKK